MLSLPTGVLSLPLAALFFVCSRAVFLAAPKLSERLEEAIPSSSFGVADKYLCTNSETVIYV